MDKNNLTKTYTNCEVTIIWRSALCQHSGNCVRNNPEVFRPGKQPWIVPDGSATEKIIETVNKCPSGALTFFRNREKQR